MSQHVEALERANIVRLARAELKKAVKAREVMVAEILAGEVPDWLERMPFFELCGAIPRFSDRHFTRLVEEGGARPTLLVGQLTRRQRGVFAESLAVWESAAEIEDAGKRCRARAAVV